MASVWTIGDIHGESAKLTALLGALPRTADDVTVFLGDYIDRGADSAGVVRRVLAEYDAAPDRTVLLWGNHEDMAAAHFGLSAPSGFVYDPLDWFHNGGVIALESWGVAESELLTAPLPPDLARLIGRLRLYWRAPAEFPTLAHCVWVHAGILPDTKPEDSPASILLWVRDEFLNIRDTSGRIVIHGHTPYAGVQVLPDRIALDTGAVFGGVLTALQLPEGRLYQADALGTVTLSSLSLHR